MPIKWRDKDGNEVHLYMLSIHFINDYNIVIPIQYSFNKAALECVFDTLEELFSECPDVTFDVEEVSEESTDYCGDFHHTIQLIRTLLKLESDNKLLESRVNTLESKVASLDTELHTLIPDYNTFKNDTKHNISYIANEVKRLGDELKSLDFIFGKISTGLFSNN